MQVEGALVLVGVRGDYGKVQVDLGGYCIVYLV